MSFMFRLHRPQGVPRGRHNASPAPWAVAKDPHFEELRARFNRQMVADGGARFVLKRGRCHQQR